MDILKILQESTKDLIPEDLDFFETELATGGIYDAQYQLQCRSKIEQIRRWLNGDLVSPEEEPISQKKSTSKNIIIGIGNIVPEGATSAVSALSLAELKSLRGRSDYKSTFKRYIKDSAIIDADFVDKNFATFEIWEIDAIISVKQMGEAFLEKYFGAINSDKIARYQLFSESFFMKHFAQMDASIVLEHGKNEWRKKENRSKQLDVFLRLKGVKI